MTTRTKSHKHTMSTEYERCFTTCARWTRCNPAAHGGITVREKCACGAVRLVNRNGNHVEIGAWEAPY